ncbi:MAG: pyridoxamine 5'-phosphate oxidase family protein [Nitrosopumilaceae archaeon]
MKQDKFLKSQKILRLATIDKKGTPHIVPVWYLYEKGFFYIGTNTGTQKAKNVKRNPKISYCVDAGIHSPIYGVMGIGIGKLILKKKTVSDMAKKILLRYFENLNNRSAQELFEQTDCIIKIIPRKTTVWKF